MIEDDEEVVMATTDMEFVGRKRKAADDEAESGDFLTSKKRRTADGDQLGIPHIE